MAAQGPRESPSAAQVKEIADRWALGLSDEDAAAYTPVLDGFMDSVRKTQELIQEAAKAKSVRKVEWRKPTAEENPLNAWYVKTDIIDPAASKEGSLLAGKTVAVKDNVALAGVPVMNGSAALEGHIAESDATIVSRILAAGGRIMGKATCEDLCLSGGSFTSLPGPVRNPHDQTKQSGGSSSGSGALVAAGEVDLAIACDQGGSIRIPSCWCGVVGFKPTHGLVPYSGIFSMEPSFDHCGPVAKTVSDCALFLQVLAGRDGLDTRQINTPAELPAYGDKASWPKATSLRIGVLKEGFGTDHSEPEVDAAVRAAAEKLTKLGCDVKEVSVPMHLQGGAIWTAVGAEGMYKTQFCSGGQGANYSADYGADMVAAFHKGMSANAQRLSHTNKLFLILGEYLQTKYGQQSYAEGREMAMALTAAYDKVLNEEVDVLLLPTLPMRPTPLPEAGASAPLGEAVVSALGMIANTAQFNVTGHPALTVPVQPEGSLPIGAMIIGKKFGELAVLSVGAAIEGSGRRGCPWRLTPSSSLGHFGGIPTTKFVRMCCAIKVAELQATLPDHVIEVALAPCERRTFERRCGMKQPGPRESPSAAKVKEIGDRWALGLSDEDAAAYAPVLDGFMGSVRKTQELIQEAAKAKSVRKVDWRKPTAEENPLNAWYVKTDIIDPAAAKEGSLLAGKTIALKDNVALAGVPVMNGSAALEGHIAESDATIVSRILAAGGRITGKATCEDLCLSGGSFTSLPAPVLNPHDRTKQSGGSSSGSAALVAAGEVDLAIACDQGGSIRIPSCWCGVVGLKPTHGLVPYSGIFSMDPSLDHCGPVAKTVAECAAFLQVLAGRDGLDTRQVNTPAKLPAYGDEAAWPNPASLRIGVLKEGFGTEHSEPEVDAAVRAAAEKLKKLGCDVKEVSVPMHLQGGHIWTAVGAEGIYKTQFCGGGQGDNYSADYGADMVAAFNKGMSAHAHRLSHTNKLFLILGAFLQMKYGQQCFAEGREMAMALTAAYDKVLKEEVDVLLLPTLPMRATPLPEKGASAPLGEAVASALGMIANTAQFNVTGHPALTVPVHPEGSLPIGAMIVGKKFDEVSVLSVGAALEGSESAVVPMSWCQTASRYLCPKWSS